MIDTHPLDDRRELFEQKDGERIPYAPDQRWAYFERYQKVADKQVEEEAKEQIRQGHIKALLDARPTDPFQAAVQYLLAENLGLDEP